MNLYMIKLFLVMEVVWGYWIWWVLGTWVFRSFIGGWCCINCWSYGSW